VTCAHFNCNAGQDGLLISAAAAAAAVAAAAAARPLPQVSQLPQLSVDELVNAPSTSQEGAFGAFNMPVSCRYVTFLLHFVLHLWLKYKHM
jgi:hypothetical protein